MKWDDVRASTYHAMTAVWGDEFTDLFLNVCIPNQLTPSNLDALPKGSRYRVFTTIADARILAASPALDRVRAILPVDIVEVDPYEGKVEPKYMTTTHRHKMLMMCLRRSVADAAESHAALLFIHPDFVLAEGTFRALRAIHESGKRAVLTANLRLCREQVVKELECLGYDRSFERRVLVELALRHLHPSIEALMVDTEGRDTFPTAVYWPVR